MCDKGGKDLEWHAWDIDLGKGWRVVVQTYLHETARVQQVLGTRCWMAVWPRSGIAVDDGVLEGLVWCHVCPEVT